MFINHSLHNLIVDVFLFKGTFFIYIVDSWTLNSRHLKSRFSEACVRHVFCPWGTSQPSSACKWPCLMQGLGGYRQILEYSEFWSAESMSNKDQLCLLPFCCLSLLDTGFLKNGDSAWSFFPVTSPAPEQSTRAVNTRQILDDRPG